MGRDKFTQAMCPFHSEENLRYSLTSLDGTEAEDIFYWQGAKNSQHTAESNTSLLNDKSNLVKLVKSLNRSGWMFRMRLAAKLKDFKQNKLLKTFWRTPSWATTRGYLISLITGGNIKPCHCSTFFFSIIIYKRIRSSLWYCKREEKNEASPKE